MTKLERIESYGKWVAKDWWLAVWIYLVSFVVLGYTIVTIRPRSPIYSILAFAVPVLISNRLTWICKIKDKRKLVAWVGVAVYVILFSLSNY